MSPRINIRPDYQSRRAAQDRQREDAKPPAEEKSLTRKEVQDVIDGLEKSIEGLVEIFATKTDMQNEIAGKISQIIGGLRYVTEQQATEIAEDAVPASLRGLDSDSTRKGGDTLMLISGYPTGSDKAAWKRAVSGLTALGTKVLYKGIFLREYDENGVIVAAGSEIDPSDYATQALYEAALLAASHTLKATWDFTRAHQPAAW